MNTVNFTQARANLNAILDGVTDNVTQTIITRRNKPAVVVMSLDEFNGLQETLYLMSSPANAAHLLRGIEAVKRGEVEHHELIDV